MPASHHRLAILGTGPAGYTAAIYASRASLAPVVFEGSQPGGQLTITTEVENFPGFTDGIQGPSLMDAMREQALKFGASIRTETVLKVDLASRPFRLATDQEEYTCDGFFYRGKEIAVIGGGDTALEEALFLSRFASKVTVVHRRDQLRASKAMQERVFRNEKIHFAWNKIVAEILTRMQALPSGEEMEKIRALRLKDVVSGESSELPVEGLFVAIGHKPNTELFLGQLALDEAGYLKVEKGASRTEIPGVFAAGDVQDHAYRQAITAAGSGCMAAIDAERWLLEQGLAG